MSEPRNLGSYEPKMNDDQFEQRLRRQPLRRIPAGWREQILTAARPASPRTSTLDSRQNWFLALLWPHPRAWAGLAAVWLVILTFNLMMRDEPKIVANRDSAPPSAEVQAALREQHRLFVELAGVPEFGAAVLPKVRAPGPRSEGRNETMTA